MIWPEAISTGGSTGPTLRSAGSTEVLELFEPHPNDTIIKNPRTNPNTCFRIIFRRLPFYIVDVVAFPERALVVDAFS
jgi:hypothetical protein